ncbi:AAA family ATPase [Bacillus benzoevorans]
MIPWRLNIAGVRDFPPQSIDLSGEMEHIGILGPNGSGKSTLSFCMGAVLHSGKVDISGLRSANLPAEQMWKANISLLFKNDGLLKVDAPKFIQFELQIEQTTPQTIAREYTISSGDDQDEWEEQTKFKSGDRVHGFSAYKKLLQTKYHIDPDYYYLIWYQNEVNQFSEMAPEERFRIFSEMHGIDKIQKNWEESRELVKEAETSLEEAKFQQENRKFQLNLQKQKLNQYNDNQKRLQEGFLLYYQALSVLISKTQDEIERCIEDEALIQEKIDEVQQQLVEYDSKQTEQKQELIKCQNDRGSLEQQVLELQKTLNQLRDEQQKLKGSYEKLEKELAEIRNEISRIPDETTVERELANGQKEMERLDVLIQKQESRLEEIKNSIHQANIEVTAIVYAMKQDETKEIKVRQLLELYKSSHAIEQKIEKLDGAVSNEKDQLKELQNLLAEYKQEEMELKQNELSSPRQKKAKQYFSRAGIEAFTLRELVKLDDSAKLSDEKIFDAIKYTMFVNSRKFTPPNDLYFVSLPMVVPDGYITSIEEYHLSIRDDLSEQIVPYAVKALSWVHSFFTENSTVKIENGSLWDEKGWRGTQEEQRCILSVQAVQERLSKLTGLIGESEKKIEKTTTSIRENEEMARNLRNIVGDVKDAEAFQANEKHRVLRQTRYESLMRQISEDTAAEKEETLLLNDFNTKRSEVKAKWDLYLSFKKKWEKFAEEKEKINQLYQLKDRLDKLERQIQDTKNLFEIRSEEYDHCQDQCSSLQKSLKNLSENIQDGFKGKKDLERQLGQKTEDKEIQQNAYFLYNEEINDLEKMAEAKVKEEREKMAELPSWNISEAREFRENGKAMFTHAVNEKDIDHYAPENYQKMKEAYDQLTHEVNESQNLLTRHQERMEQLRNDLDSTISGKVLLINKHFVTYIGQFGFDGEIDWDMHEDKKGTTRYYLYLKARKYGHRMTMEDVSVKARGGRQGVGLSGGEKSLVSLLYALALLQTIQTNPSFIVLDEFDSALDEGRKVKVFDLYVKELGRKMIILTPKSHDKDYFSRFHKAYIIYHRPDVLESGIMKVRRKANHL